MGAMSLATRGMVWKEKRSIRLWRRHATMGAIPSASVSWRRHATAPIAQYSLALEVTLDWAMNWLRSGWMTPLTLIVSRVVSTAFVNFAAYCWRATSA